MGFFSAFFSAALVIVTVPLVRQFMATISNFDTGSSLFCVYVCVCLIIDNGNDCGFDG